MSSDAIIITVNLLTTFSLVAGLFFMLIGAIGIVRFPDIYSRSHAAGKCVTLGISGMLIALVLFVSAAATEPVGDRQTDAATEMTIESGSGDSGQATMAVTTKALLVIFFSFLAVPVGSHMLARAAHLAGTKPWSGTLSDDLADDEQAAGERDRMKDETAQQ